MDYAVGSLVKARGREWVVLPESNSDLLVLRPLGGTEDEITGVLPDLEDVDTARFALPDPQQAGDHSSARLLRDAVRLGFRSSAGPFRCYGRLAFDPRPYQLVPLLMALKLDPVRLLIGDDVGIGKTIEAGLVARELLDRGEIERLAVLCPPPLAEQWQAELRDKFHIEAELVLSRTAARLERGLSPGQSLFEIYPYVIVSTDYIKTDRRRDEFLRACPELVIVDEAHTCAFSEHRRGGRHQRFQLVSGLASDPQRHLILVTATPHSGDEGAFRSLLTFLNPEFAGLPEDLTGPENEHHRRRLAAHFVQRRRGDIYDYLDEVTPFPRREDAEATYRLHPEYRRLFDKVLTYARENVIDPSGDQTRQRVRWWSALALLRSLASSPAAGASTLHTRAMTVGLEELEEVDQVGRRTVLDLVEEETAEGTDLTPGSDIEELAEDQASNQQRLLEMACMAEDLMGEKDAKLSKAIELVKGLLDDGYHPIVFCRFIPTAGYVAEALREGLPSTVEVSAVTGLLPPEEREFRVRQLGKAEKRVLVCTDCLSEGINLQERFDAVMHYDLSWNPTRHEQREGRVDRYGQPRKTVRALTYYGTDNRIDGIVLDVLIRKHRAIRNSLGISVPVPVEAEQVIEAIFEGLLLREGPVAEAAYLPGFEEYLRPHKEALFKQWEVDLAREERSQTMFAQRSINPEEVGKELEAARSAVGSGVDVEAFTRQALRRHGAVVTDKGESVHFEIGEVPQPLKDALGFTEDSFEARFELPVQDGQIHLTRTHPAVEGLASYIMESALDPLVDGVAKRCGAIRTCAVSRRTTLLSLRFRYHILTALNGERRPLLAEEAVTLAFAGALGQAEWIEAEQAEKLLGAEPTGDIIHEIRVQQVAGILKDFGALQLHLEAYAQERGQALLDAHLRVRQAAKMGGKRPQVEPLLPPDVLGVYVLLPDPSVRSKGDRS